ncbi:DNA mismatch repair protein MutS2 [Catalinimonas alkaloidigena]|uniref:Endonuclease MutS2 n=1 Tax=Catalinimonas alkaloidigena TaxID=1075417 RepID=A0A1G8Y2A9_9BACT|nr:endonuclease MutS2 [Catalinimonas alkaloidigena]SDJ96999.1 DNA mismatch repair protein MutS2 [Catalinimonas alkaloidigena]
MIYPKNFEQKIGFDQIRTMLREACAGPLGLAYVDRMRFTDHLPTLEKLLNQTDEFRQILERGEEFPVGHFVDVSPLLRHAEIENSVLDEEQFFHLKSSVRTVVDCKRFFKQAEAGVYPTLTELGADVQIDKQLPERIDFAIDDRGQVRDTASSELQSIRRNLISERSNLRKRLDRVMKGAKEQGYTPADMELTIRNGRLVIPVLAEHKRRLKGFIHDESATGQTVFIEPAEVFEANNRIRELELEERREIYFILKQLTDFVRPFVPSLREAVTYLGLIDFIRAKARLALRLEAIRPPLESSCLIDWQEARHPLLFLSFREQGRTVVPLSLHLDPQQRLLIISGPNAGGKSVCLKTVGLVQYMLQCGLLVPMKESSKVGIFQSLFIDIGDEQSLENDLSTYSSHLQNMRNFLNFADKKSLILVDEFGAGTEPQLGGAIAEAMLEEFTNMRSLGVITTHYANLKGFAERHPGVVNGAMRFDVENLEPLYQLSIGKPGSSFALEVAAKIGLPKRVLENAETKVGSDRINYDKMLRELEIEKEVYQKRNTDLLTRERQASKSLKDYSDLRDMLDRQRKTTMNQAKAEARRLVEEANQRIERTIRSIRENQAEKEATRQVRQELDEFREEMKPEEVTPAPAETVQPEKGPIEVGSYVRIKDSGAVAEVVSIRNKEAEVLIGSLKSNVKLNRLQKISRRAFRDQIPEPEKPRSRGIDMNEKMQNFSFNLDVRGKRSEEALNEVVERLDDALLVGATELRIVHGKGDGILRELIRNHLRTYPQVASMQDEHADRGGSGVTLVTLH